MFQYFRLSRITYFKIIWQCPFIARPSRKWSVNKKTASVGNAQHQPVISWYFLEKTKVLNLTGSSGWSARYSSHSKNSKWNISTARVIDQTAILIHAGAGNWSGLASMPAERRVPVKTTAVSMHPRSTVRANRINDMKSSVSSVIVTIRSLLSKIGIKKETGAS